MWNKLRAWWAIKRDKGCESNHHGLGAFNDSGYDEKPCGRPSVATVWLFTNTFRVCRWHIEPLEVEDGVKKHFACLIFISRWQRPVPKEYRD